MDPSCVACLQQSSVVSLLVNSYTANNFQLNAQKKNDDLQSDNNFHTKPL